MTTITLTQTDITRKISKVKIGKNGCPLVEFEQTRVILIDDKNVDQVSNLSYEGRNLPHPDFVHAMELLRPHVAILCSQLDGRKVVLNKIEDDQEFMALFKATGFSIGGSGEHEGVTLIGSKKIKRGNLNLVTPFTKFLDENDPYEYQDELSYLVNHCIDEANAYVDGKISPNAQAEIPFGDEDENLDA